MTSTTFFSGRLLKGLLLLCFLTHISYGAKPSGRIESIGIAPDGRLLVVEFKKGATSFIYKVDVATGNATRLTKVTKGVESSPVFSADGKRIAFTYWPNEEKSHSGVVLATIDGLDIARWSPSEVTDFSPVLSPDNKTIVFARSAFYGNYSPIAQPYQHAWSFHASDLDGKNVRQLTNESFYMASPPSISPDGKTMAVVTEGLYDPRKIAIYSVESSGKPLLSLRPHVPKEADHKDPILNYPNYMPDGKSILFMAASNGLRGYDYDIYRVEIESGTLERLTKGNGFATELKVSADGKTAVFLKWRSDWRGTPNRNEIYLLDVQTHQLTLLKISRLD